jgi:GTP-binding protein Era
MEYRSGFVGLIGQPNAGKSTLMNFLIDQKVSIVTSKPQTTRRRVVGIQNISDAQIVFVDAPGIIKAEKGLNAFLVKEAEDVMKESDVILAVLNIDESSSDQLDKIINLAKTSGKPWMGIITKTDVKEKAHRILILKDMVEKQGVKCLQISSLKCGQEFRESILFEISRLLPLSVGPLYDENMYTTENVRQLCSEIIREKCFEKLNFEIPYQLAVNIRKFDENENPCPKIFADIVVAKESHKPIVVGKKASVIKEIGQNSRKEIEALMGQKIYLELNVTVKENWFEQVNFMKELGYDLNDKR